MKITNNMTLLCRKDTRLFHALKAAEILEHVMLHYYDREYSIQWDQNEQDKAAAIKLEVDKKCDFLSRTYLTSLYGINETWGFAGEESFDELELKKEYYWCVDPICGSLGYNRKSGNFGSSVALVHNDKAILGVMNCPIRQWTGAAVSEPSAKAAFHPLPRKEKKSGIHIVASANRKANEYLQEAIKKLGASRVTYAESIPVKALGVLLGKFDLFYALPQSLGGGKYNVWDIAATLPFAEAEKVLFTDAFGNPLSIDPINHSYYNGIIMTANESLWERAVKMTKLMGASPKRLDISIKSSKPSFYFVTGLKCVICGREFPEKKGLLTCPICGEEGILDAQYDYEQAAKVLTKQNLSANPDRSHWRYLPLVPAPDPLKIPILCTGGTPLYDAKILAKKIGIEKLWIKDDGVNPTASLKDRASSVGVARALAEKARGVTCASTGNAASSLAGAAAAGGLPAFIFVPEKAPQAKIAQLLIFGAKVFVVKGSYEDAFRLSMFCAREFGFYNRNSGVNPWLVEGKKTVSLEICEQLNWVVPDFVSVAVGDGCSISGVWKGFVEMRTMGFIEKLPRLIGVQAKGAAPVSKAWKSGKSMKPETPRTIADSIAVGAPRNWIKAVNAVKESGGFYITVTDEEILSAMKILGNSYGIFGEPAGVTGLAGIIRAKAERLVNKDSRIAAIITGNGLKDIASALKTAGKPYFISPDISHLKKLIPRNLI
ncbi:threonine synthase [Candidatus Sumerlaeota bacterium]|nr:threonine synthase [Candidatus Sumerlaeota bacterium]